MINSSGNQINIEFNNSVHFKKPKPSTKPNILRGSSWEQ